MLKTVKGKVVAGVVSVGLLSGVGSAFAFTDAGGHLQNWYKAQFEQSANQIQRSAEDHVKSKATGLYNEYQQGRNAAVNAINGEKNTQVSNVTSAINNAKQTGIDQVNNEKSALEAGMSAQFDGIKTYANSLINRAGQQLHDHLYSEFSTLTSNTGAQAISDMQTQINASQETAKGELQAAIDNAKSDLQGMLAEYTTSTSNDINAAIDQKIAELRAQITAEVVQFVNAQKAAIDAEASNLQTAALSELDAVVNGIDN